MLMADSDELKIDSRSGFCKSNTTFYSKRKPVALPPADESLDVTTFISSRQHHHNGQVALIDAITGQKLTYAQVWTAVDSVAKCLSDLGIRKGHVILLLSPNSIFFPVICLSVFSVGAIITTANPLNTAGEISKQISDSKPVLAFTVPKLLPKLFEACNHIPTVIIGGESNATNIVDKLDNMMKQEITQNQNRVKNRVTQSDVATMLYSSGTTGTSKGVISSHRNFIALVQSGKNRFKLNDTLVCTVPLFHIFGLGGIMMNLGIGATTVILSKFDLDDLLSSVQKYKATYLPLVPPILISLVNEADEIKRRYDLSSLKAVLCGGASLRKEVIESFVDEYPGIAILQGYAMTESAGGGASTDTMEESLRYGTVGLLTQCMEARIVDPDTGKLLPVNQTGELWLRGPTVMTGYFSKEEATTSTLSSDGWLRTGDICYFDDDGFLFIVDRLKELIKYKGYQVAPAELEALLLCHQEIADACVIPFPDKEVGQFPMAYVVRKSGSYLTEEAIKDFVAKQVAPYKKIRRVAFITSVPRNPSGKILRKDLIKLATSKL